jgi:hypothetical protein
MASHVAKKVAVMLSLKCAMLLYLPLRGEVLCVLKEMIEALHIK